MEKRALIVEQSKQIYFGKSQRLMLCGKAVATASAFTTKYDLPEATRAKVVEMRNENRKDRRNYAE